jgi:hypothetical protein
VHQEDSMIAWRLKCRINENTYGSDLLGQIGLGLAVLELCLPGERHALEGDGMHTYEQVTNALWRQRWGHASAVMMLIRNTKDKHTSRITNRELAKSLYLIAQNKGCTRGVLCAILCQVNWTRITQPRITQAHTHAQCVEKGRARVSAKRPYGQSLGCVRARSRFCCMPVLPMKQNGGAPCRH